ncbi:hypothetical protein JM83_2191 [Gillisia sp. Hel_I_86]|nr:hypothetical protein [Gillisia sp. Hel_I_86]TVZ27166.1 hypothetical protein JM83_2191 [Gillisia sp. Hel_I_86]
MKECCKTGSETKKKESSFKKWLSYILYAVIAIIVIGALLLQLKAK